VIILSGRGQVVMAFINWATHVLQWLWQRGAKMRIGANLWKAILVRIVGCNSSTWSRNR